MKKVVCRAMLVCILSACFAASQEVSKRLTNQDILDMVKLGLSNDVIIAKIRSAHGQDQLAFDTGVAGLKSLKAANVPDEVIKVMINPAPVPISLAPAAGGAQAAPDPNFPRGTSEESVRARGLRALPRERRRRGEPPCGLRRAPRQANRPARA